MLRLLCVTAHPDDEAGGFGGTLLHYAHMGVETHVICMTAGHAATHRGNAKSDDELKQIRRREFAASCRFLQVKNALVLDYPDGKLDQQDVQTTVADLTRRVREIRPQVIMTFGSEGAITAHPDHSMVSTFTTLAFHWAGRSNRFVDQLQAGLKPHITQKLYHSTTLFTMPDRQPVSLAPATAILELGQEGIDAKTAAFKCHTSQAPLFWFFEESVRRRGKLEMFHLMARSTPMKAEMESDLFAGVVEHD
ncbi:MAG: PIG-L family deacetylase [Acidobacteriia bacterium]|nr:PIG-L family deacetylase [Terriglobia bacterium]